MTFVGESSTYNLIFTPFILLMGQILNFINKLNAWDSNPENLKKVLMN